MNGTLYMNYTVVDIKCCPIDIKFIIIIYVKGNMIFGC
jgi:hypothetical protein